MDNQLILLEFFDDTSNDFYRCFPEIQKEIINELSIVQRRLPNDYGSIINPLYDEWGFRLIDWNYNRYIFHSPENNISYFISFNSNKLLEYCCKISNYRDIYRFLSIFSSVIEKLKRHNNQPKYKSYDNLQKELKNKKGIKKGVYVDDVEYLKMNNPNYKEQFGMFEKRYFQINKVQFYLPPESFSPKEEVLYSIYRINVNLNDLNKELVNNIFSQMDYFHIQLYKLSNHSFMKYDYEDNIDIPARIKDELVSMIQDFNDDLDRECLEMRKNLISKVLEKYKNANQSNITN